MASASFAFTAPLGYVQLGRTLESDDVRASDRIHAGFNVVSHRYFGTMRIPIERGRTFTEDDTRAARTVAVVNRRLAERLWPGADPIGRRFRSAGAAGSWIAVVGITRTGKYHFLFEEPLPFFYLPVSQHYTGLRGCTCRPRRTLWRSPPRSSASSGGSNRTWHSMTSRA